MSLAAVYQPIACALHEKLEFAVLKRTQLYLCYCDAAGQEVTSTALPVDVYTANAAEWLKIQHADGRKEIVRLDALLSVAELV